jgi:hypothetical protein
VTICRKKCGDLVADSCNKSETLNLEYASELA